MSKSTLRRFKILANSVLIPIMKQRYFFILPIAYMLFIFILSSIPADLGNSGNDERLKTVIQNILHIPLFGLLSFLWIITFRQRGRELSSASRIALAITIAYSVLDEYHQYYVPGRFMGIMDIGLDVIGAFSAWGIYWLLWNRN